MSPSDTEPPCIASLLADARAHVTRLTNNLPTEVDPLAVSLKSKTPYLALCFREGQAWRAEEFARAACDMFERGDDVVGVSNTRGAVESVAAIWYLKCLIEGEIERGVASADVYAHLKQLHLGSRSDNAFPKAINATTMLKKADAEIPGVWRSYELMSEFGHPNYWGSAGVFGSPDRETLITYFGKGRRKNMYPARLGLTCLIAAMGTLFHAYNKISDMTPDFAKACERENPHGSAT